MSVRNFVFFRLKNLAFAAAFIGSLATAASPDPAKALVCRARGLCRGIAS